MLMILFIRILINLIIQSLQCKFASLKKTYNRLLGKWYIAICNLFTGIDEAIARNYLATLFKSEFFVQLMLDKPR